MCKRNIDRLLVIGGLARNPSMRLDGELNPPPFGLQETLNPLSHTSQATFFFFLFNDMLDSLSNNPVK